MPRESASRAKERRAWLRILAWAFAVSLGLCGSLWAAQQFEHFLIDDSRFILPEPADYGQESPNLHIDGVTFASRAQIQRVFSSDLGRSVYLLPLADRRRALLRLSWVRDAGIVRIWPNRVFVHIVERSPAAFIEFRSEGMARWALIDSDGVILDPPERARFHLPVIAGVKLQEKPAMRGVRVRRMQNMLKELGPLADKVSEVDVSDLDDLKVTEQMQDHAIVLM